METTRKECLLENVMAKFFTSSSSVVAAVVVVALLLKRSLTYVGSGRRRRCCCRGRSHLRPNSCSVASLPFLIALLASLISNHRYLFRQASGPTSAAFVDCLANGRNLQKLGSTFKLKFASSVSFEGFCF